MGGGVTGPDSTLAATELAEPHLPSGAAHHDRVPEEPIRRRADVEAPGLFSVRMTAATARRVLAQLRGDHRTVALVLVTPSFLLWLINRMYDNQSSFNHTALSLLGIFPFTTMFLITSVAMLRERTSGTLERLLTTPISKLDLLMGYGIAFAVAAAAQAAVASAIAYWLLGLYTPGNPVLVVSIAIVSAVLGMSLGLLASAFATSEFQAVQFMPALVMPQILLGGLFVPRTQMVDWLYDVSAALPMTYDIEALGEVGKTSLITAKMLRDTGIMAGVALLAVALAAVTLRRRTGPVTHRARRALTAVLEVTVLLSGAAVVAYLVETSRYVRTENAEIDGDKIPVGAPATGTIIDWSATQGATLRKGQIIGRVQGVRGDGPQHVIRAPADGTVVQDSVVSGVFVTAATQLAVVYDLSQTYVTARVMETSIGGVHLGQPVDISVDAYPNRSLTGTVWDIQGGTAGTFAPHTLPDNSTGSYQKVTQVIPVMIVITDRGNLVLVPGMNVTVHIHKS
jgi:ABC-2 type transport system permease protein